MSDIKLFIAFFSSVVLLFFSAFFSASEVAFFKLSKSDVDNLRKKKLSRKLNYLFDNPKKLLASLLIGNNLVNISIVIVSSIITEDLYRGDNQMFIFIIQVIVVTLIILFLGEIIPKIYASKDPFKFVSNVYNIVYLMVVTFSPLSWFLMKSTKIFDKKLEKGMISISKKDLSEVVNITAERSETTEDEKKILKGIARIGDIMVKEVMTSRMDVSFIDEKYTFAQVKDIINKTGYSRYPVIKESADNVVGVLYVKDVIKDIEEGDDFKWQNLKRKPFFVPETKKLDDLLKEFQEKKVHIAIVVDEYGGTSGIVTLENIVEEIVGEINDEFDNEEEERLYKKLSDNVYIFEGKINIKDFCRILNIPDNIFDDIKGEADSLAGIILEMKGEIPAKNTEIVYKNIRFVVESSDKRRIYKIRVRVDDEK